MSTLSKVLLGLVTVAAIGLTYLGIRAYGTLKNYGENYAAHVNKLEENDRLIADLLPQLAELKSQLEITLTERTSGRIWYGKGRLDNDAIKVTIGGTELPASADDNAGEASLLFVYETWDEGGMPEGTEGNDAVLNYLGEFKVTFDDPNAIEDNVTLEAVRELSEVEQQLLAASVDRAGVRWIMYEEMPADNYSILAGMTREEISAMFPGAEPNEPNPYELSVHQLAHHGETAQDQPQGNIPADPPERIMVSVKFLKSHADLTPEERTHIQETLPAGNHEQLIIKDKYVRFSPSIAQQLTNPTNQLAVAVVESPVDAEGNQEPERMYVRMLRDFDQIFRNGERQLIEIAGTVQAAKADAEAMAAAVVKLQAELDRSDAELTEWRGEQAHMEEEQSLVQQVATDMQARLDDMLAKVATLKAENLRLAEELRQAQISAAQAINDRTETSTLSVSNSR
ncbi:MAG: hypothetical protein MPJ50_16040 [Pirellulales bacterium]|nr:hypothetical protein [Pirellulales bacterium]